MEALRPLRAGGRVDQRGDPRETFAESGLVEITTPRVDGGVVHFLRATRPHEAAASYG